MKTTKGGSLIRLVAFFLIAVILTCTVTFAASGWQSFLQNEPDSDDVEGEEPDGEVDENTDGETNKEELPPPTLAKHYLTGYTIDPNEAYISPISFIYSSSDPLYGISDSIVTIEIPTENGETRYICFFQPGVYLGKIGSIAPTRDYISLVVDALGGLMIHRGNDDAFKYREDKEVGIDILTNTGYSYTEYTEFHYTNSDLVKALIKNCEVSSILPDGLRAPFIHATSTVRGKESAHSVTLPYSDSNITQLIYNEGDNAYVLFKGSDAVKDLLNDKSCSYENAFILYANATTYETADNTETVLDTKAGGEGYYFTLGTAQKISWMTDSNGNLVFYNSQGEILNVNMGRSYIAFEKASMMHYTTYN